MYKVGMILLKGLLGQPKNPREAVGWLKRAAERADGENPHALHELGLLYESAQPNDAIIRDEAYAYSLFLQAADLGYNIDLDVLLNMDCWAARLTLVSPFNGTQKLPHKRSIRQSLHSVAGISQAVKVY
ncbi:hypothetical protein LB505_007909 [Fusarium chuoi]|nr:hypothetical protein LB505_007909 [Fusarium chuoi]